MMRKKSMNKESYSHAMIRDIHRSPRVVEETLRAIRKETPKFISQLVSSSPQITYIIGSGTSYHAGLAGQYALSALANLNSSVIPASELPLWIPTKSRGFILLAFSQSGESLDILNAVKFAKKRDAKIIAITNNEKSSLANLANHLLLTKAGEETAIAATKTYLAQVSAIYQFSLELSKELTEISSIEYSKYTKILDKIPELINEIIVNEEKNILKLAKDLVIFNTFFLLGSGPNYASALEGALKLQETCNLFSEGFSTREFLHGPMQLVDKTTPLFFIVSHEDNVDDWIDIITKFKKFEAPIITIAPKNIKIENYSKVVSIPKFLPKIFSPIINILPLQLFAYYSSLYRGLNPDQPEKLSKVVKS